LVPNSNNGSKLRCFQFLGLNFEKWKGKKMIYYLPIWPKFWEVGNFNVPICCFAVFRHQFYPPCCWPFSKRACWTWDGFRLLAKTGEHSLGRLDGWPAFWVGRHPPPTRPLTTGQTDTANSVPNKLGWPPLPVTHRLTPSQTTDKPPNKLGWPPQPVAFPDSADLTGSHQSHL
jgi:hypothetical protein